ncbi:hypothetical protein FSHL1_002958 [Fusarium sambucinum]
MSAQSSSAASTADTNNNENHIGEETNGRREEETRVEMTNEEKEEEERYQQLQLDLQRRLKQKVAEFKAKPKDMDKKAKAAERDAKRQLQAKQMWMPKSQLYPLPTDEMRKQLHEERGMVSANAMHYSLVLRGRARLEDGEMTQSESTATTAEKNNIENCTREVTSLHHGKEKRAKVSEEMRKSVVEMLERKDWDRVLRKLGRIDKISRYGGIVSKHNPKRDRQTWFGLNQRV